MGREKVIVNIFQGLGKEPEGFGPSYQVDSIFVGVEGVAITPELRSRFTVDEVVNRLDPFGNRISSLAGILET